MKTISDIKLTNNKKFFSEFAKTTIDLNLKAVNSFLNTISETFLGDITQNNESTNIEQANKIESLNDLKKETYYNVRSLHQMITGIADKNVDISNDTAYISNPESISKISVDSINEFNLFSTADSNCDNPGSNKSYYDIYKIFQVVDRGNNDIGNRTLVNLGTLYNYLYPNFKKEPISNLSGESTNSQVDILTQSSFHSLFSQLGKESGFNYQQIPNYLNINGALSNRYNDDQLSSIVDDMFGVHTDTTLFGESLSDEQNVKFGGPTGLPGAIFQIGVVSSTLDDNKNKQNDYTNSFCLDLVLDNNNEISVNSELAPQDILNSNVSSFIVDFGTQNQQMFKGLQIDTSPHFSTEHAIKSWTNLVNNLGRSLQTTNIFPIYENISYSCTVTSLGNATIQPLSYFYLRNTPLYHGTYWITNVSHKITPNTMITEFKGSRQPIASKGDTRRAIIDLLKDNAKKIREASGEANVVQTEGLPETSGKIKIVLTSDKPYKDFIQEITETGNYAEIDGKTILGSYIYSITNTNRMTAANYGMVSYLYKAASGYVNSENIIDILPAMVKVAIGQMRTGVRLGDTRYGNANELSLSYLLKNSGQGYTTNGDLSEYLNELTNVNGFQTNKSLPKQTKAWDIKASGSGGSLESGSVDVSFTSVNQITPFDPGNIDIGLTKIFIDPNGKYKANDTFIAGDTITIYDLFSSLDNQNFIIGELNKNIEIKKPIDDTTLRSLKPKGFDDVRLESPFSNWLNWFNNDLANVSIEDDVMQKLVKFALVDSDGTYDEDKLAKYIFSDISSVSEQDKQNLTKDFRRFRVIRSKLEGAKILNGDGSPTNFYQKSIFSGIQMYNNPITNVKWIGAAGNDLSFDFKNDTYEVNLDTNSQSSDVSNFNDFINNIVSVLYRVIGSDYINNQKSLNANPDLVKFKFLGAYGIGENDNDSASKIGFFTTEKNFNFTNLNDYIIEPASASDSIVNTAISPKGGQKRTDFTIKITTIAEEEFNKWRPNGVRIDECDADAVNHLNRYWGSIGSTLEKSGGCKTPWSAAFISYAVKKAGATSFSYANNHGKYIEDARNNKNLGGSSPWFGYDATSPEAKVEIGDLVCYTRGGNIKTAWNDIKSGVPCHCDIVVSIDEQKLARTIGGNLGGTEDGSFGGTVGKDKLQLNDDNTININDSQSTGNGKKIYRGVLKYQPVDDKPIDTPVYTVSKTAKIAYDKAEEQEPGFKEKVKSVAQQIGAEEMDLVQVMFKESAGTLSPSIKNEIGCVGLIQFCPDNSRGGFKTIGKTKYNLNDLQKMTRTQQMDVVLAYFKAQGFSAGKKRTIADLYCATFYPVAVGKNPDFIIGSERKNQEYKFLVAKQNPGIAEASNKTIDGRPVVTIDGVIKFITA